MYSPNSATDVPAIAHVANQVERLYCVSTRIRRAPELMQLERVKSIMR